MEFEAVIGLEVHVQLATESKIFCGCRARLPQGVSVAEIPANANTCPICAGHPGVLPVLNKKAVEYAIRAGLATNCRINTTNLFARKNYFYPDLPKGFQTTQYELPICEDGWIEIPVGGATRRISIVRIQMEEDAGKNLHLPGYSLVNLNRAGVPLVEIVGAPDLRSAEEAGAYLRALYGIVTSIGICDGNLQEGNFRCDANVSVRPSGSTELGTRAEIKNVNSFRFVEKAIEHEIARQVQLVRAGGRVVQETRGYDSDRNVTTSMRSKEEAHDYRYFPEPDLVPIHIEGSWIEEIRENLPELPAEKMARYVSKLGLSAYDAGVLTGSRSLARYFEETLEILAKAGLDQKASAKPAANLFAGEIARLMNEEARDVSESKLQPAHVAEVIRLLNQNTVSSTGAKKILQAAWKEGDPVDVIVDREGLRQVSDLSALEPIVEQVLAANVSQAEELRAGKEKLMGFFVGQIMKQTGGKANPALLQELIRKKLGK